MEKDAGGDWEGSTVPPQLFTAGAHHLTGCSHSLGRNKVDICRAFSFRRGERSFQNTVLPLSLPAKEKARVETRLGGKGMHQALLKPRHGRVSSAES